MAIPSPDQLREIGRLREGSLAEVPFAVLLHGLAARGRTMLLAVERRQMVKTIVLEDGVPVDCRSNLVHETLGRFMVAVGKLSEEDSNAGFKEAMDRGVPFGQVLIEKRLLSPVDLFKILQQNLAKKLLDLFTWREGRFRVGFEVPEVDSSLKVRVPQLVVMGITKFAAQEEVNAAVVPLVGKPLALHPSPPFSLDEIRLSARQAQILEPLRQRCRMDELAMATGLPPDEMTRLLYALAVLGVVVPADQVGDEPVAPTPERKATPPTPPQPAAAPPGEAAAAPKEAEAADAALVERLSNEVMQAYLSFRRQDALELLGAAEDAPLPVVQERYLDYARRFLPDRFGARELQPFAEKARELFLAGARAYAELADPEQRRSLLSRRKAAREQPAPRPVTDFTIKTDLLDPDVQYRKGKALMAAGQHLEAIQQLEFAADCDPGNGLYRAELAYCRYLHLRLKETALQELGEVLRIDPGCGLAAFYTGEIYASQGRREEAERCFRQAIKPMAPDRRPIDALKALGKPKR